MNRRLSQSTKRYLKRKEQVKQEQIEISQTASQMVMVLANAANTIPEKLISDNQYFEKAVNKVVQMAPTDPVLMQIPALREDLGFVFFNRRVPFISSKMLQPGQKLRVTVNFKGKSHSYVSTLLNSTETDFWVKPPTVKGKAVDISRFKTLEFRVFRKSDGEFMFVCNLKRQIKNPTHAVVLAHTNQIKRIPKREADRYTMRFKRSFYFITTIAGLETPKSSPSNASCEGVVLDMSIGGMKISVKKLPSTAIVGTTVVFGLPEAGIKNEINGNIVRIAPEKDGTTSLHLQFYDLSELSRLYLQKFIAKKDPPKNP